MWSWCHIDHFLRFSSCVHHPVLHLIALPLYHHFRASQTPFACTAASSACEIIMHLFAIIALVLLHFGVASARYRHQHRSYGPATTTTITITTTVTDVVGPTSAALGSFPPTAYTVIASRPDAPFHLLPLNAAGFNFTLGGSPAIYCPNVPMECPAGNVTAFYGSGTMVSDMSCALHCVYLLVNRMLKSQAGSSSTYRPMATSVTPKHILLHIHLERSWHHLPTPKQTTHRTAT